ncbi:MAG: GNAT family N-acetyltransferase [Eubacteriales bacterium]|nr:GNAT family N-acetyltransferase [Eubacteriales bacterium]
MIRKATIEDIPAVAQSYQELFRHEAVHGSTTNWAEGLYPTKDTAAQAFDANTLYVLEETGAVYGSVILDQTQPPEYGEIDWAYPAEPAKVVVIHTLCICPSQAGKGYGRQMVSFALEKALQLGCKAVRLDTWEGNHPAASLYESMGFRLAGSAPMCLHGVIQEQQIFLEREVKCDDPAE